MSQNNIKFRTHILTTLGAGPKEVEELLDYNRTPFSIDNLSFPIQIPLDSEYHLETWKTYEAQAKEMGVFATLQSRLVQLQFPIEKGISQSDIYRSATLRGESPPAGEGLVLEQPETLELTIHESVAGAIPILIVRCRSDFVSLVQALTRKNEPDPIPDSMGACMVAGFNNWDRIWTYKEAWLASDGAHSESDWLQAFRHLISQKHLYQDRFLILSAGFYSDVSPEALSLPTEVWRDYSLRLRLEHECIHYFTKRLFNTMRNHLLDELLADYAGCIAATGCYHADWFLHFLGLEAFPAYREDGRLQIYVDPLSDSSIRFVQAVIKLAAENVERFDNEHGPALRDPEGSALMLLAIASLNLEEMASPEGYDLLTNALNDLKERQNNAYV